MSLPLQPPSSEETEQPATLHSSEETPTLETPTLPSPTSDPLAEETEQPATLHSSEETPTLSSLPSDPLAEEPEQQVPSSETDRDEVPAWNEDEPPEAPALDEDGVPAWNEDEPPALDEDGASALDEDDDDDDEDFESTEPVLSSSRPGVFIHKGVLIAAACAVVVVALLVVFLVFFNHPKDPPSDWIASTPASTTNGETLYYLHWTNQNGDLKGQLKLSAKVNSTPQSLTAVTIGLYNKDNHIIYVVVTINGQPNTLTGKINDNNDTLTLNLVDATNQGVPLVFHTGSSNDYDQAVKKLK